MGQVAYTTEQINLAIRKALDRYEISLQCENDATTLCTTSGQWYDIDGLFSDGSANGFDYVSQGGIMEKTGDCDCLFFFTGDSDLSIGSASSTITYGLFVATDGVTFVEVTRFTSGTDFSAQEGQKSLGTNGNTAALLPLGTKMKVMVKSSTAGVTVTHHTLKITINEL